jgi:hypothetical protein
LALIAPTDKGPSSDLAIDRKDGLSLVDANKGAAGALPEREAALARVGKTVWAGIKRVNRRVGEAEARLILRIFYYTVFGVVSLVRRSGRRKSTEGKDQVEVTWSPRTSPGTDPTKQY